MASPQGDQIDRLFDAIRRGKFSGTSDPFTTIHETPIGSNNPAPNSWYAEHRYSSSIGQTNVLLDPTLETLAASLTLSTTPTATGLWKAHYSVTSGAIPATRLLQRWLGRGFPGTNPFNSALALLSLAGSAAGVADIYIYPKDDYAPASSAVLDYLLGGVRLYVDPAVSGFTALTAVLEIYDATNSAVVATSADTVDLLAMAEKEPTPLIVSTNQTSATFRLRNWRWRLKIHMDKAAVSGDAEILIAEPQLHFNYIPDILPYAPLVANWFPPTTPSPALDLVAGTTITPVRGSVVMPITATGGSVTITAAPTIPDGVDGQEVVLLHVGSSNNVTIQDQGTLASSNLRLTGASVVLGPRDSIRLVYSTTVGDWVQIGNLVSVV